MHSRETPQRQRDEVRRERPQGSAAPRVREELPPPQPSAPDRGKAEASAGGVRPCAVIGPERAPPPIEPYPAQREPWSLADVAAYRFAGPNAKPPPEHLYPPRNISPRQTFQENMRRILVPPRSDLTTTPAANFSLDGSISNVKMNAPADLKYCEVPYVINQASKDHRARLVRSGDMYTSNVPTASVQARVWPAAGPTAHPAYFQSDVHYYGEYQSCAMPTIRATKQPIKKNSEVLPLVYNENYFRGGDVRFEPYSASKVPHPRYEYFPNPQPTYFPTQQKYDSTQPVPPNTYGGYAAQKLPQKYIDTRVIDHNTEAYTRQAQYVHNLNPVHPADYNMSAKFAPPIGSNTLPNKVYGYPLDSGLRPMPAPKGPYDATRPYYDYDFARMKQVSETPYPTDISYGFRGQVPINNYPTNNVPQGPQNYMYYPRMDNAPLKNYPEHLAQYRPTDGRQSMHNPLAKIPAQFSPNVISPSESNTSSESIAALANPQEDCGYVSQCSTTSGKSTDYPQYRMHNYDYNMRSYDGRMFFPSNSTPNLKTSMRDYHQSPTSAVKSKKSIDVRQFLQMWDEDDEDVCSKTKSSLAVANQMDKTTVSSSDTSGNQEPLYVLGLVNIPSEEVSKYEHIQKVCKLPENIKGYDSADLLNKFDEAFRPPVVSCNVESQGNCDLQNNGKKRTILEPASLEVVGPPRPLSPLDVEAKITQSVIHKEVGCNFEIKPCSPLPKPVDTSSGLEPLLAERKIEKVANLHNLPPSINTVNQMEFSDTSAKCGTKRRSQGNDSDSLNNKILKTAETGCISNSNEGNYNIVGDKEYNTITGVCLASLPRLDNILELNFPEINKQYSDLKQKQESVITSIANTYPQENSFKQDLDVEKNNTSNSNCNVLNTTKPYGHENSAAKHFVVQSMALKENLNCCDYDEIIPISPTGQFNEKSVSKLTKFRKTRPTESNNIISDIKYKRVNSPQLTNSIQRTDSVIMKNPDNIENTLPTLDLTEIEIKNIDKNKSHWTHPYTNQLSQTIKIIDDSDSLKNRYLQSNVQEIYSKSPINLIMHSHYEEYTECIRPSLIHCAGPQSEVMIERSSNIISNDNEKVQNDSSDSNSKVISNKKSKSKLSLSEIPINVAINLSINSNHPEVAGDVLLKPYSPHGISNEEEEPNCYAANAIPCKLKEKNDNQSFISECAISENVMTETQTSTELPCLFEPIGENEEIGVGTPMDKAWEIPSIVGVTSKDQSDKVLDEKYNKLFSDIVAENTELKSNVELGETKTVRESHTLASCEATSTITQEKSNLPILIKDSSSGQLISDGEFENNVNKCNEKYECIIEETKGSVDTIDEKEKSVNPEITDTTSYSETVGQPPDGSISPLCPQSSNIGDDEILTNDPNIQHSISCTEVNDYYKAENDKRTDDNLFQGQKVKITYQDEHELDEQIEENIENIALHIIATKDIYNRNSLNNEHTDNSGETSLEIKKNYVDSQTCQLKGILSETCPAEVLNPSNQTNSEVQISDLQGILSEESPRSNDNLININQAIFSTNNENLNLAAVKKDKNSFVNNLLCNKVRQVTTHKTDLTLKNTTGFTSKTTENKKDQGSISLTIDQPGYVEYDTTEKTEFNESQLTYLINLNVDNIDTSLGDRDVGNKEVNDSILSKTDELKIGAYVESNSIENPELKSKKCSSLDDENVIETVVADHHLQNLFSSNDGHICEQENKLKEAICKNNNVMDITLNECSSVGEGKTSEQIENRIKEPVLENNEIIEIKNLKENCTKCTIPDDVEDRENTVIGNTAYESSNIQVCAKTGQINNRLEQSICRSTDDGETKWCELNLSKGPISDVLKQERNFTEGGTPNEYSTTSKVKRSEQIENKMKEPIHENNEIIEIKQPKENYTGLSMTDDLEDGQITVIGNTPFESSNIHECEKSEQNDGLEQSICRSNNDGETELCELNLSKWPIPDVVEQEINSIVGGTPNESSSTSKVKRSEQIENKMIETICENNGIIEIKQLKENYSEFSMTDHVEDGQITVIGNTPFESYNNHECEKSEQNDGLEQSICRSNNDGETGWCEQNLSKGSMPDVVEQEKNLVVGGSPNEFSSTSEVKRSEQSENKMKDMKCDNNDIEIKQHELNTETSLRNRQEIENTIVDYSHESSSMRKCQKSDNVDNIQKHIILSDNNDDNETNQPGLNPLEYIILLDDTLEQRNVVGSNLSVGSFNTSEGETCKQIENRIKVAISGNNDIEIKQSELNHMEFSVPDIGEEKGNTFVVNLLNANSSLVECQTSENVNNQFKETKCDSNGDDEINLPELNSQECSVSDNVAERWNMVVHDLHKESSSTREEESMKHVENNVFEIKLPELISTECSVPNAKESTDRVVGSKHIENTSTNKCQSSNHIESRFKQAVNRLDVETKQPELKLMALSLIDGIEEKENTVVIDSQTESFDAIGDQKSQQTPNQRGLCGNSDGITRNQIELPFSGFQAIDDHEEAPKELNKNEHGNVPDVCTKISNNILSYDGSKHKQEKKCENNIKFGESQSNVFEIHNQDLIGKFSLYREHKCKLVSRTSTKHYFNNQTPDIHVKSKNKHQTLNEKTFCNDITSNDVKAELIVDTINDVNSKTNTITDYLKNAKGILTYEDVLVRSKIKSMQDDKDFAYPIKLSSEPLNLNNVFKSVSQNKQLLVKKESSPTCENANESLFSNDHNIMTIDDIRDDCVNETKPEASISLYESSSLHVPLSNTPQVAAESVQNNSEDNKTINVLNGMCLNDQTHSEINSAVLTSYEARYCDGPRKQKNKIEADLQNDKNSKETKCNRRDDLYLEVEDIMYEGEIELKCDINKETKSNYSHSEYSSSNLTSEPNLLGLKLNEIDKNKDEINISQHSEGDESNKTSFPDTTTDNLKKSVFSYFENISLQPSHSKSDNQQQPDNEIDEMSSSFNINNEFDTDLKIPLFVIPPKLGERSYQQTDAAGQSRYPVGINDACILKQDAISCLEINNEDNHLLKKMCSSFKPDCHKKKQQHKIFKEVTAEFYPGKVEKTNGSVSPGLIHSHSNYMDPNAIQSIISKNGLSSLGVENNIVGSPTISENLTSEKLDQNLIDNLNVTHSIESATIHQNEFIRKSVSVQGGHNDQDAYIQVETQCETELSVIEIQLKREKSSKICENTHTFIPKVEDATTESKKEFINMNAQKECVEVSNDIVKLQYMEEPRCIETKDTSINSISIELSKEVCQVAADQVSNYTKPVIDDDLLISKIMTNFLDTKQMFVDNTNLSSWNEHITLDLNKNNTNSFYSSDQHSSSLSKISDIIVLETGTTNLSQINMKNRSSRWDQKERPNITPLNYSNEENNHTDSFLTPYKAGSDVTKLSDQSVKLLKQSTNLETCKLPNKSDTKLKFKSSRKDISNTDRALKRKSKSINTSIPAPITRSNNTDLSSSLAFIFENLYRKRPNTDEKISNAPKYQHSDSFIASTEKIRRRHISNIAELFFSDKESETQRIEDEKKKKEISDVQTHNMRENSQIEIEKEITCTAAINQLNSRISESQDIIMNLNELQPSEVAEIGVRSKQTSKKENMSKVINALVDRSVPDRKTVTVNKSSNKRKRCSGKTEILPKKDKPINAKYEILVKETSEDIDIVGNFTSDVNLFTQQKIGNIQPSASDDCNKLSLKNELRSSDQVHSETKHIYLTDNAFKSTSKQKVKNMDNSIETKCEKKEGISKNTIYSLSGYLPLLEEGKIQHGSDSNKSDGNESSTNHDYVEKCNSEQQYSVHKEEDFSILQNIACTINSPLHQEIDETFETAGVVVDSKFIIPEQIVCMEPDSTQECYEFIYKKNTESEEINNCQNENIDFSSNECNTEFKNQICENLAIMHSVELESTETLNNSLLQTTNRDIIELEECDSSQNNETDNNAVISGITYAEEAPQNHINSTLTSTESSDHVVILSSENECLLDHDNVVSPKNTLQFNIGLDETNFDQVAKANSNKSDCEFDNTLTEDGCSDTSMSHIVTQTQNLMNSIYDGTANAYEMLNNNNPNMEYDEIWIDDVACVETVVSEDVEDEDEIKSESQDLLMVLGTPEREPRGETNDIPFSMSFNSAKMKNIYGNDMDNNDIYLLETLYKTPHMDVRNKLNETDLTAITSDDLDCNIKAEIMMKTHKKSESISYYKKDSLHEGQEIVLGDYSSENSEVDTSAVNKSSTIPTCTTTGFFGNVHPSLQLIVKEPEKSASSEGTSNFNLLSRKVLTKAARKYIPPIKLAFHNLKVKLPLPEESLVKLKELKVKKKSHERSPIPKLKIKTSSICKSFQMESENRKKVKPKFEDVLKHIDDAHYKLNLKLRNKRNTNTGVPKVIIKKTDNGSRYTSKAVQNNSNRDLTGSKWQPWVYLEKNELIEHMIAEKSSNAFFCHQSNEFILQPKLPGPDMEVQASPILIIKPQYSVEGPGYQPLKYTILLNPKSNVDNIPNGAQISHTSHIYKPAPSK